MVKIHWSSESELINKMKKIERVKNMPVLQGKAYVVSDTAAYNEIND